MSSHRSSSHAYRPKPRLLQPQFEYHRFQHETQAQHEQVRHVQKLRASLRWRLSAPIERILQNKGTQTVFS